MNPVTEPSRDAPALEVSLVQARLAAIVSSSDDVIISKTLDGIITSWNASATRILGFTEAEMVGQSILRIIPTEFAHEEIDILRRIKLGERIEHFDTLRLRKDGTLVNLSLTVSPLRDAKGNIVGASKVARDITDRKKAEELQVLLFRELNHRVKNTLAIVQSIAWQSLRRSASPNDFIESFTGRIQSLAAAHNLLVKGDMKETSLAELVEDQVVLGKGDARIFSAGPTVKLSAESSIDLALLLHELASNARKYGALSIPAGRLEITWRLGTVDRSELMIEWRESGLQNLRPPEREGFGTSLIENTLLGKGGRAELEYAATGLICKIRLPLNEEEKRMSDQQRFGVAIPATTPEPTRIDLHGRTILIVEDEAIIALEVSELLKDAGMKVIGPAFTLRDAHALIEKHHFDVALLDANLNGSPVDELAEILSQKSIPFAFCTGFGREALPQAGKAAPILAKPFGQVELVAVVNSLFQTGSPAQ